MAIAVGNDKRLPRVCFLFCHLYPFGLSGPDGPSPTRLPGPLGGRHYCAAVMSTVPVKCVGAELGPELDGSASGHGGGLVPT